jgi:hypothetical protein
MRHVLQEQLAMNLRYAILSLLAGSILFVSAAVADQSRAIGPIIAFGETKRQIEATPILERPYRPLHFYGNTVRRRASRGLPVPATAAVPSGAIAQPQR